MLIYQVLKVNARESIFDGHVLLHYKAAKLQLQLRDSALFPLYTCQYQLERPLCRMDRAT